MRIWAILLAGVVLVAAAAFGVRHYGIDLAAIAGLEAPGKAEGQPRQAGQRPNRGPTPVETARAQSSRLSDDVEALGTLLSDESVSIAPETSGRVARVLFEDGATVKAGTPLFQFDTDLAQSELAEAEARLRLAEANYARNEKLRKSGNVAESAYEEALSARDVARAAVVSAEVRLAKLTIAAPFPGALGFRSVSEGAYVNAGTPLVQLDKVDKLQVSFSVPELQQAAVENAAGVTLTADALPGETFNAAITALSPAIDVNGRALQVRAELDNSALKLRPGLLVRVTVKGPEREAVLVPESAVVQRGEGALVYVIADNKAKQVRVSLGKRLDGKVEVLDGIAAGDAVVTAGNARLSDGAEVEVVSAAAAVE